MEKRVKNIFANLEKKPDAIIIKNSADPYIDNNFFYVTGLEDGIFEGAMAILHPDGDVELFVSELEAETAKKSGLTLHIYENKKDFEKLFKKNLPSFKKIGINSDGISHKDFCRLTDKFPKSRFIDVSDAIAKTRLIKDEFEIELIKKACAIVDKVMKKIPSILHEGMYEYEIAAEINYLMQKNGAGGPAFDTISSFGKNTAEPHYTHGDSKLSKCDFALCDFGALFRRYNSDITRTFVFGNAIKKRRPGASAGRPFLFGKAGIPPGISGGHAASGTTSASSTEGLSA